MIPVSHSNDSKQCYSIIFKNEITSKFQGFHYKNIVHNHRHTHTHIRYVYIQRLRTYYMRSMSTFRLTASTVPLSFSMCVCIHVYSLHIQTRQVREEKTRTNVGYNGFIITKLLYFKYEDCFINYLCTRIYYYVCLLYFCGRMCFIVLVYFSDANVLSTLHNDSMSL